MEEFKDYVNKTFTTRKLDINKCNINNIKIDTNELLDNIKKVIKKD